MATGPLKPFATQTLDCDEEFSEFCENFTFSDTVFYYFLINYFDL